MPSPDMLDTNQLLIRIDERTANMGSQIQEIKSDLREFREVSVTKSELNSRMQPLEAISYGFVGLILVAVIGAVIAKVIIKKPAPRAIPVPL